MTKAMKARSSKYAYSTVLVMHIDTFHHLSL